MGKLDAKIENLGGWRHVQKLCRENYAELTNRKIGKGKMIFTAERLFRGEKPNLKQRKALRGNLICRLLETESIPLDRVPSRICTLLAGEGVRNPLTGRPYQVWTISRDLAAIKKHDRAKYKPLGKGKQAWKA